MAGEISLPDGRQFFEVRFESIGSYPEEADPQINSTLVFASDFRLSAGSRRSLAVKMQGVAFDWCSLKR